MNPAHAELLLRKLPEFYETRSLEQLPARMVQLLGELVPGNLIAYNEVDLKTSRARLEMSAAGFDFTPLIKVFEAHLSEHPLLRHQQETNDLSPRKISDFLSKGQFHRLGIYQELYGQIGCEDQIALALHNSPSHVIALAINRDQRSFTADDLELLRLAQPHLMRVHQNALAQAALQRLLSAYQTLLDTLPLALVLVRPPGRIEFATNQARDLMRRYFPGPAKTRHLPEPLRHWLKEATQWAGVPLPAATGRTLRLSNANGKLTVRFIPGSDPVNFLLLEETSAVSPQPLKSLGLTRREAEVLFWVAQGKSSPDISIILGSSARTVHKHLEHIFSKLGVESRTAAAQRAWEILGRPPGV